MHSLQTVKKFLSVISILVLCSCAANLPQKNAISLTEKSGSGSEKSLVNKSARDAIEFIRKGDLKKASHAVNQALLHAPENANLHFLNGFVYNLMAGRGDPTKRDFAETGYLLALKFSPNHPFASYFLGQLYLDSKRWRDAQERFAQAIWIDGTQPDAYFELAVASYYARDLPTAKWAVQKSLGYRPSDAGFLKAAVMVTSASGDRDDAQSLLDRYRKAEPDKNQYAAVERRVQQWDNVHELHPMVLADISAPQAAGTKAEELSSKTIQSASVDSGVAHNVLSDWRSCEANNSQQSWQSGQPNGNNNALASDETASLPALASPCEGKLWPKMAIIDTTILRTNDTNSHSNGLNILDGLSVFFTSMRGDAITTTDGAVTSNSHTWNRTFGLGTLAQGGISYSLNMFNATDMRAEVLARPSLVALDRTPSLFFSGSYITFAVTGQQSAAVADRPVGVSLSVTPTFINDDSMMLAVKATRSIVEVGAKGVTFEQQMQTSRNAVTANVMIKYGQTLVLSGLSERESQEVSSGVPGLKDLPVLQYLFGTQTKSDITKSVVIMLTPRRPVTGDDIPPVTTGKETDRSEKTWDLLQSAGFHAEPNMSAIFRQMSRNPFYREFRNGDLASEDWRHETYVERLLNDFATVLFF